MTNTPASKIAPWKPLIAGTVMGVLVISGGALIQHQRHGWPFSLHHDVASGPAGHDVEAHPTTPAAAEAHKRVAVALTPHEQRTIGVTLETVKETTLTLPVRAVANVVPDESRVSHVHARVAGWLEELYVNTTGQTVKAGQAVAGVFSQELFATQNEYLSALKATSQGPVSAVVDGARTRLKVLGMSEAEIRGIERSGEPRRLVTLTAPRSGVVLRRGVSTGTSVDPSTEIVTVADLSSVWVWAEVPESAAGQLQPGAVATLSFPALGNAEIQAPVDFVYPTLTERSRTLRVRFKVPNAEQKLMPGLFGTAMFESGARTALTVPRDAVVDTGLSQHVFVMVGADHFEPRRVILGARMADRVEILEGLQAGEAVVASGVFFMDSESRLRASGGAGTGHAGHGTAPAETPEVSGDKGRAPENETGHEGHGG